LRETDSAAEKRTNQKRQKERPRFQGATNLPVSPAFDNDGLSARTQEEKVASMNGTRLLDSVIVQCRERKRLLHAER
jgi:hypothetical protein